MKKFKILVIAHSLKQNKVAKYGDVVFENQLTGPASELIEAGFIEEVLGEDGTDEIISIKSDPDEETELIPVEIEEKVLEDVTNEIQDIDKPIISKDDLKDIKKVTGKK